MTFDECVAALQSTGVAGSCVVTESTLLDDFHSLFGIAASIAVIAAAAFAWQQVRHLKLQIVTGRDGAIQQINATRDTAFEQIKVTRESGMLVSTLNLLIQIQTNEHWRDTRQRFIEMRDSKDGLRKHANEDTPEAMIIRHQLNQYELIALGIKAGILDEVMYRKYYRGTVLRDWTDCLPFISEERKENNRYWIELEDLVERFKAVDPNAE